MTVLQELSELSKQISNPYIDNWQKQGNKTIGYFCSYIPEEIILAAGMLPYRVRATGSTETTMGDAYMGAFNCSFIRHCLDQALRGSYNFLDGVVMLNGCDHVRRLWDTWRRKVDTPFCYFLQIPHLISDLTFAWYKEELIRFKESIEEHFQVKITDQRLREAIKTCNETRTLLGTLYQLRKKESPPITGTEALNVIIPSTAMPKDQFNGLLKRLLTEIKGRNSQAQYRARLMVVAIILDDPSLTQIVEETGGLVVADFSCIGPRHMWDLVDEAIDPMEAIAKRYLGQISCPRMMGDHQRRSQFIRNMVDEYKVDGIIFERIKFCDLWGVENYMLRVDAKEADIPTLVLEREFQLVGLGQFKTRVQAFLEMLEGKPV